MPDNKKTLIELMGVLNNIREQCESTEQKTVLIEIVNKYIKIVNDCLELLSPQSTLVNRRGG
jgi:hypothetical protein